MTSSSLSQILVSLLLLLTTSVRAQELSGDFVSDSAQNDVQNEESSISVAHMGNSIQFYNDCPRLLQRMLQTKYQQVISDSCFKGGANVTGLFANGNGMDDKFDTPNALLSDGTYDIGAPNVTWLLQERDWDFVVINDHTQAPAREENRTDSMATLRENYLPLIPENTMVILLMTAAYRAPAKKSGDLGGFDKFTELLEEGYEEYQTIFPKATVAHFGLAYKHVRDNYGKQYWNKLYMPDDFHPSPHGTYLEACVLYCTITGEMPPTQYDESWWSRARFLDPPMPFPSLQDAQILQEVAGIVCGIEETEVVPPHEGFTVVTGLAFALLLANIVLCRLLYVQQKMEAQERALRDGDVVRPKSEVDSSSTSSSNGSKSSLSKMV